MGRFIKTFTVSLLGDSKAGKTALKNKAIGQNNPLVNPTLGAEPFTREPLINGQKITLECWDCKGAIQFLPLTRSCIQRSDAIIIAIDLTRDSVSQATGWIECVKTTIYPQPTIILVGTKSDLTVNTQQSEALSNFAQTQNMPCFITSAKNDKPQKLNAIFTKTAQLCLAASPSVARENTLLLSRHLSINNSDDDINSNANTSDKTFFQKLFGCCK